jgi:hypothetical protein
MHDGARAPLTTMTAAITTGIWNRQTGKVAG